jgi:hypothetical protein
LQLEQTLNPIHVVFPALALGGALLALYRYGKRRNGIDGALALLVSGLLVLSPIQHIAAIGFLQTAASDYPAVAASPYWDLYYTFAIFITTLSLAVSIFGGMGLLVSKRRSAVIKAHIAIWISGPLVTALYLLIAGKVAALYAGTAPDWVSGFLPNLGLAILASTYLARSARVKALYSELAPESTD